MGLTFFPMVINLFYAYCFYFGGYLRWSNSKTSSGEIYDANDIITIIFLLLLSTMGIGIMGT